MTDQEFNNHVAYSSKDTLLSPKTIAAIFEVSNEADSKYRMDVVQGHALNVLHIPDDEFTGWATAELKKYDANPAEYYHEENVGPRFNVINAAELQAKHIDPVRYVVDKILTTGLTVWASPPKYGKSWGSLDIVLSVAMGTRVWGYMTHQCRALYLALEDSEGRLQRRMEKILKGKPAPPGADFITTALDLDNGLLGGLEEYVQAHPDTGLIVIDTFQKIRGGVHGRENPYAADYRECAALKAFADAHNLALLVIHHLRKMSDDADPFNRISGTTGISGAADSMWVLSKSKRGDDTATLTMTGRDIEQMEIKVRFNKDTCQWENLGDAEAFEAQQALAGYERDPIVGTIRKLLAQSPTGTWSGTAAELMTAGRVLSKTTLAATTRELTERFKALDRWLFEVDGITHDRKKNGSGGGRHVFSKGAGL